MLNIVEMLLKEPVRVADNIEQKKSLGSLILQALAVGLVFHAVYGFAMAMFHSLDVAYITAIKSLYIVLFSMLLCLPSLYIFSCLSEMHITLLQAVSLGSCVVALSGLLLMGLVPVSWLFSVSTDNIEFIVIINIFAWITAVSFSFRILRIYAGLAGRKSFWGLRWWLVVFLVVSFQMTTTMRPLLDKAKRGLFETGKEFFLEHFSDTLD